MTYDVAIAGGGLAGLSAAVRLTSAGARILLLEQKHHLGGRTYSFIDAVTGDVVDNGQHLMMGCYHETRRYLHTIGTDHLASLQPSLHIEFLHPNRPSSQLRCPSLPAPWHVLAGMLRLSSLSIADRLRLLRVGAALLSASQVKELQLDNLTVDEWLTNLGQSGEAKKYLWDIIAVGSLNDDPKRVSAMLFHRVLRTAFLGKRENSSFLIPHVGLSELLVDRAIAYVNNAGGNVRTDARAIALDVRDAHVAALKLASGERVEAHAFISAVPWHTVQALLPPRSNAAVPGSQLLSSPIITINLWFDRAVMEEEMAALLDCRVHWIFNRSRMLHSQRHNRTEARQFLAAVISGASDIVDLDKDQLVAMTLHDLCRVLPMAQAAKVIHSLVIKEKRATFSARPHLESARPQTTTEYANLFLAGDWTATGYPATIEGAVLSGHRAADAVAAYVRTRHS